MTLAGQTNTGAANKPKRSIGKLLLKLLGGFIIFVAVLIAFVMWLTSDIADAGKEFFSKLRDGDINAAYGMTTPGFKTSAPLDRFETFVRENGLLKPESPSWSNRNIEGSGASARGTLKGTFKSASGESRSVEIKLAKVAEKWRIQYVDVGPVGTSGGTDEKSGLKIPDERELIRLTHEANMVFARSVAAKSMQGFHAFVSERFRAKFTVADTDKAFGEFISKEINLAAALGNLSPAFTNPPKTESPDSFSISGAYETRPSRVTFDHTYAYEGLGWKLISYNIRVRPAEEKP